MTNEELQAIRNEYENAVSKDSTVKALNVFWKVPTLLGEIERLRGALEFYADDNTYITTDYIPPITADSGERARKALAGNSHDN